jgi:hypothetical protein
MSIVSNERKFLDLIYQCPKRVHVRFVSNLANKHCFKECEKTVTQIRSLNPFSKKVLAKYIQIELA